MHSLNAHLGSACTFAGFGGVIYICKIYKLPITKQKLTTCPENLDHQSSLQPSSQIKKVHP